MESKMLVTVVEMMPQDRESEKGLQHEPDAFQETQQVQWIKRVRELKQPAFMTSECNVDIQIYDVGSQTGFRNTSLLYK